MSDLTVSEQKLLDPPGREHWLIWTALASLALHAGVLALILVSPLRSDFQATPPSAIEVVLVPPAEETPSEAAPEEEPPADTAEAPEEAPAAPTTLPAASAVAEPSPAEPSPAEPAASAPIPDPTSQTESEPVPDAAEAAAEPAPAAASAPAPIPLPRPAARTVAPGSGGGAGPSGAPVTALEAEVGAAEGNAPGAPAAEAGVADLDLGEVRSAERFYLEAMLREPSLARAGEMLKTLPREKRLSQTCNIEALAQIGFSGEDYAPDVVMTDAYALSVMEGTRLSATGAIFRSRNKWYGLAFDCTLSPDLSQVTAFSYRLGADVTESVLERMKR